MDPPFSSLKKTTVEHEAFAGHREHAQDWSGTQRFYARAFGSLVVTMKSWQLYIYIYMYVYIYIYMIYIHSSHHQYTASLMDIYIYICGWIQPDLLKGSVTTGASFFSGGSISTFVFSQTVAMIHRDSSLNINLNKIH